MPATVGGPVGINDLATTGYTLGFGETLDNPRSVVWNAGATTASGNGLTNNRPFLPTASFGNRFQTNIQTSQNKNTINDSISSKIGRYCDTTQGGFNNIYGAGLVLSSQNLINEFRPTYQVLNTSYMVWYDYAVIRLSTLFESLGNIGLIKKIDCTLRLWVNTGTVNVTVSTPNMTTRVHPRV